MCKYYLFSSNEDKEKPKALGKGETDFISFELSL